MLKNYLLFCLVLFSCHLVAQDDSWELKKTKNDLKIYTRNINESGIKELKIVTEMETSMTSIIALFDDVPAYVNWVYSTGSAKMTKQLSPSHMHYYSVSNFPWPLSDRDVMLDSKVQQDSLTKIVTSTSTSIPDAYPRKKGMVRVEILLAQWVLVPKPGGKVEVTYTIKTDPGGNIPVVLTNAFIDRGPIQTFAKMREMLKQDKYKNAQLDFIEELEEVHY